MLHLDATQLYDLSEAGRLLHKDPARLAREARLRRIPAARVGEQVGLPAPWVEAEAGLSPSDPGALCLYWLERLAPPSREARRPLRARGRLPVEDLLEPDEAARRICASAAALRRLDEAGTLPSLRLDGEPRYDALLTDLVACEDESTDAGLRAEARRAELLAWSRYEYATEPDAPATPAALPAQDEAREAVPAAYEIPADLGLDEIEGEPQAGPSTLIEADGFETIDED